MKDNHNAKMLIMFMLLQFHAICKSTFFFVNNQTISVVQFQLIIAQYQNKVA